MKKLMFAALMMFAGPAFATDAYSFKNLGFSADGRYYAFIQSVVQDGSGFPSAKGQVIDVANNDAIVVKHVVLQDENATLKQATDQAIAQMRLGRYGIDGRNPGKTLWVRMQTDLTPASLSALFSTAYGVDGGASSVWPKYKLDITERPAAVQKDECYGFEVDAKMITVSLTDVETNSRRDLQVDNGVPAARHCSWGYQVRQVLAYRGAVAAVLRYETLGFEGPDYAHMVVTGARALQ